MVTTIVMPVSRPDFLKRIFAQLDMMPCDRETTNILVYVDGSQELFHTARNFVINSKFKDKLCVYRKKGLPATTYIKGRRKRIAEIHNEMREIINFCDYVFLLEDDTLMPLNTLEKLLQTYMLYPHAGFITGVQIGRWGINSPGLWKVDSPYDVKTIESILPPNPIKDNIQELDAAGIYCALTKMDNYKKTVFEPFDEILGPDVSFGLSLRREGYKNYVDWSINTSHLTKRGEIKVYNTTLQKVRFTRDGERWNQEIL